MTNTWVDSYYESLEFFYWEPQHIGCKKHANAGFNTFAKVRQHLHNMEVTLNQTLHQFLALAPRAFRNEFLGLCTGTVVDGSFVIELRDVDERFKLMNAVQPDLIFVSTNSTVAIEMKIGARSSVTQVQKYVLLGLAIEQVEGRKEKHSLGLLGKGQFTAQFKEGFNTLADLRSALHSADHGEFLSKQPPHLRERSQRFSEIASALEIGFASYDQLAQMLDASLANLSDTTAATEVYQNLLRGMLSELRIRSLAQ